MTNRKTARLLLIAVLAIAGAAALAQPKQTFQSKSARVLTPDEEQVLVLINQSAAHRDHGQLDEAASTANRAMELARVTRMRDLEAAAYLNLGLLAKHRGEHTAALKAAQQSVLLCEIEGNLNCQANARGFLGEVYQQLGRVEEAARETEISSKFAAAVGDARGTLNAATNRLMAHGGTQEQQRSRAEALLDRTKEGAAPVDEAVALRQLGRDALEAGDHSKAQKLFDEALARAKTALNPRAEADSLVALGELAAAQRKFPEAQTLLERALVIANKSGNQGAVGNALLRLATVHMMLGENAAMKTKAERALAAYTADGQVLGQGLAHEAVGDAEWFAGRREVAETRYREAIRLAVASGNTNNEAGARLRLATLLRAVDHGAAMSEAEKAAVLYRRIDMKSGIAATLLEQAWIHGAAGDLAATVDKAQKSRELYQQIHRTDKVARADATLAVAWRMREQYGKSDEAANRAINGYRQLSMPREEADALYEYADSLGRQGKLDAADRALERAQAIAERGSVKLSRVLVSRSMAQNANGNTAAAIKFADEAVATARSAGNPAQIEVAQKQRTALARGAP